MANKPVQILVRATDSRNDTLISDLLPLFKKHARIDFNDDDDLCQMYLASAISRIEQWTEMPIRSSAYDWTIEDSCRSGTSVALPFRNCTTSGDQFGFELLIAEKYIDMPTTWPVRLEVGFEAGVKVPPDLKMGIFELALGLYELRSTPEQANLYSESVMNGSLSRYRVPRV